MNSLSIKFFLVLLVSSSVCSAAFKLRGSGARGSSTGAGAAGASPAHLGVSTVSLPMPAGGIGLEGDDTPRHYSAATSACGAGAAAMPAAPSSGAAAAPSSVDSARQVHYFRGVVKGAPVPRFVVPLAEYHTIMDRVDRLEKEVLIACFDHDDAAITSVINEKWKRALVLGGFNDHMRDYALALNRLRYRYETANLGILSFLFMRTAVMAGLCGVVEIDPHSRFLRFFEEVRTHVLSLKGASGSYSHYGAAATFRGYELGGLINESSLPAQTLALSLSRSSIADGSPEGKVAHFLNITNAAGRPIPANYPIGTLDGGKPLIITLSVVALPAYDAEAASREPEQYVTIARGMLESGLTRAGSPEHSRLSAMAGYGRPAVAADSEGAATCDARVAAAALFAVPRAAEPTLEELLRSVPEGFVAHGVRANASDNKMQEDEEGESSFAAGSYGTASAAVGGKRRRAHHAAEKAHAATAEKDA